MTILDAVVVGAGQAGLGVSYCLQQNNLSHVVFEQERVGDSWLSQRWESFKLNTPNLINTLPGLDYDGAEPDGFWQPDELLDYFQSYVERFQLPVETGVTVTSVKRADDESHFIVKTITRDQREETVTSRSVVIASGSQRMPKIPALHSQLPDDLNQLHTADYRSASDLAPGAVIVVGSGQSGCQIVEDLLSAGRTVYLCTSKVGRVPRRYRGRDIFEWWVDMKFFDLTYDSLEDKAVSLTVQPQVSGLGRYGHTVSLQYLAGQGAVILGRLVDIDGSDIHFNDAAAANVQFADTFSQRVKDAVDAYLLQSGIAPPPLEDDTADINDPEAGCASPLRELNLREADINTVIWTTGFTADFSWIDLPVLDAKSQPIFQRGISPVPGLYFIGFPWLNSRKSGILYGIDEDAHYIADAISAQLG